MTKMICGKWLCLTWTYFDKSIQNCFQTIPNHYIMDIGQVEFCAFFRVTKRVVPICPL